MRLGQGAPTAVARERLGSLGEPVLARTESDLAGWTLICPPGAPVRVNGTPVPLGVRTLADRDAISIAGPEGRRTVFLSLERAAELIAFPGEDHETHCIRCKLPLAPGTPAVRCPGRDCGFWHHQSAEQPCWTYTEGCANCGHPTAFDAGLQWTPDLL